jgi:hypothetical protein
MLAFDLNERWAPNAKRQEREKVGSRLAKLYAARFIVWLVKKTGL